MIFFGSGPSILACSRRINTPFPPRSFWWEITTARVQTAPRSSRRPWITKFEDLQAAPRGVGAAKVTGSYVACGRHVPEYSCCPLHKTRAILSASIWTPPGRVRQWGKPCRKYPSVLFLSITNKGLIHVAKDEGMAVEKREKMGRAE